VRSGLGVALVPEAAININRKGVAFRSLLDVGEKGAELFLTWRADNENPALRRFLMAAKGFPLTKLGANNLVDRI